MLASSGWVIGDGLEGNLWEQGLPSYIQPWLEYLHRWSVHNPLWQFIPIRDYSNAKRMSPATGFAPLLVNPESMAAKPSAGVGDKYCIARKVELHLDISAILNLLKLSPTWPLLYDKKSRNLPSIKKNAYACNHLVVVLFTGTFVKEFISQHLNSCTHASHPQSLMIFL